MSKKKKYDHEKAEWQLARLELCEEALEAIDEVARLSMGMREGIIDEFSFYRDKCRLISVVGVPRTGGSYITAELLSSLDYSPSSVPSALVHDGFPEIPSQKSKGTSLGHSFDSFAEYLVMARLFFEKRHLGRIIVPKKFPKAIRCWSLVELAFGPGIQTVVTMRDPLSCCVSAYEKAGGRPPDGRFRVRSTIEKWALRSLTATGVDSAAAMTRDYIDVFIEYWQSYYSQVALSGALDSGRFLVVPFSKRSVEGFAEKMHSRFQSGRDVTRFVETAPGVARHPEWRRRALESVEQVAHIWSARNLSFPKREMLQALLV